MKKKNMNTTFDYWKERMKLYPLPEWGLPTRLFSNEELKAKAKRWRKQMDRAVGGKDKFDSIPGDETDVRQLIGNLFFPGDAAILIKELFIQPQPKGFF